MLPQAERLVVEQESIDRRGSARKTVCFETTSRSAGRGHRVVILNLSATGVFFQTSASLDVADELQFELPEIGPVSMTVVRRDGDQFGCRFKTPLTRAAVSAVILGSPFGADQPQAASSEDGTSLARHRTSNAGSFNLVTEFLVWFLLLIVSIMLAVGLGFLAIG